MLLHLKHILLPFIEVWCKKNQWNRQFILHLTISEKSAKYGTKSMQAPQKMLASMWNCSKTSLDYSYYDLCKLTLELLGTLVRICKKELIFCHVRDNFWAYQNSLYYSYHFMSCYIHKHWQAKKSSICYCWLCRTHFGTMHASYDK